MVICEYGCGQEAFYKLKNGKICCSNSSKSCKEVIRKSSESRRGSKRTIEQKRNIALAHIDQKSTKKGLSYKDLYGYKKSEEIKNKIKSNKRLTLEKFKERYPFVYKVDLVIEDIDGIKVMCKNSSCQKWFIPSYIQIYERHRALTNPGGFEENNFYCSEKCKRTCFIYGKNPDLTDYNSGEYNIFKTEVFIKQKNDYGFNFCEKCYNTYNLLIHHEKPKKTHPHMLLDPDNGIVLCKECHIEVHKKGSECSFGNLSKLICNSKEVKI